MKGERHYCNPAKSNDPVIFMQKDRITPVDNTRGYDEPVHYEDNGYTGLSFVCSIFSEIQRAIPGI